MYIRKKDICFAKTKYTEVRGTQNVMFSFWISLEVNVEVTEFHVRWRF